MLRCQRSPAQCSEMTPVSLLANLSLCLGLPYQRPVRVCTGTTGLAAGTRWKLVISRHRSLNAATIGSVNSRRFVDCAGLWHGISPNVCGRLPSPIVSRIAGTAGTPVEPACRTGPCRHLARTRLDGRCCLGLRDRSRAMAAKRRAALLRRYWSRRRTHLGDKAPEIHQHSAVPAHWPARAMLE